MDFLRVALWLLYADALNGKGIGLRSNEETQKIRISDEILLQFSQIWARFVRFCYAHFIALMKFFCFFFFSLPC